MDGIRQGNPAAISSIRTETAPVRSMTSHRLRLSRPRRAVAICSSLAAIAPDVSRRGSIRRARMVEGSAKTKRGNGSDAPIGIATNVAPSETSASTP